ncbi:MAG: hypothetical protein V4531_12175 [Actinomycetota bacterium]
MPQLMGGEARDADARRRVIEPSAAERPVALHRAGLRTHEHVVALALAVDMDRQLFEDERGNGDRALFVVLGCGLLEVPVHLDHRAVHLEATPDEIEVAHAQTGQLPPPQAGVGEHQHEQPEALARGLRLDGIREGRDLLVGEELLAVLDLLRKLQPRRGIGRQPPVVDGKLQPGGEHVDDLSHRARTLSRAEPGGPLLRLQPREIGQEQMADGGDDVDAHDPLHPVQSRRAKVRPAVDPRRHPLRDRDACPAGVDVATGTLRNLDRREEQLSVALRLEPALVRLAVPGLAVTHAVPAATRCLVGADTAHLTTSDSRGQSQ